MEIARASELKDDAPPQTPGKDLFSCETVKRNASCSSAKTSIAPLHRNTEKTHQKAPISAKQSEKSPGATGRQHSLATASLN
jgi:hypothetical protein